MQAAVPTTHGIKESRKRPGGTPRDAANAKRTPAMISSIPIEKIARKPTPSIVPAVAAKSSERDRGDSTQEATIPTMAQIRSVTAHGVTVAAL